MKMRQQFQRTTSVRSGALYPESSRFGVFGSVVESLPKSGCRAFVVINDDLSTASLDVPGVEVLEEIPDGSKEDIGPFYADQLDVLRRRAKQLQNRENHFVAKKGLTFWIYRRP